MKPRRGDGRAGYCKACDTEMPDGPDACLGVLPGVSYACCGHGDVTRAYVTVGGSIDQPLYDFADRRTLRGDAALDYFRAVR